MGSPLLSVNHLSVSFRHRSVQAYAVQDVSLTVQSGECLALVGESGSGKSVLSLAILRLISDPPGKIEGRAVFFENRDLLSVSESEMRSIRGKRIAMIFQEPMTALNPVLICGDQVEENVRRLQVEQNGSIKCRTLELLREVGIPDPHRVYRSYPHMLSGGMKQRVLIAMALGGNPQLLIADEPTTALDVTIQAQIIELLRNLRRRRNMAVFFITHDLGLVAQVADRVAVIYAGKIQETAVPKDLLQNPRHPYTRLLLGCRPSAHKKCSHLGSISGAAPSIVDRPSGCLFHPRCPIAEELCFQKEPALEVKASGHHVRCWMG